MVFRCMELALVHRAHNLEVLGLRIQIQPLENKFLRADRTHSNQVHHRCIRLSQILNQLGELIPSREYRTLLDLVWRQIGGRSRIRRDVTMLDCTFEDRAEPPLEIPQCLHRFPFKPLLVEECLHILRSDVGQRILRAQTSCRALVPLAASSARMAFHQRLSFQRSSHPPCFALAMRRKHRTVSKLAQISETNSPPGGISCE
jgi:hypothetical protein